MRRILAAMLPLTVWACALPQGGPASTHDLFVLGVAQDGGVPHLGCERPCCEEARRGGRPLYPVSLGVHHVETDQLMLFEASPAIEAQVALLHRWAGQRDRGRFPVDDVALTHAHIGHYLGLAHLGREVAGARGVRVWVSQRFADFLAAHGPWKQLVELDQIRLMVIEPGVPFEPMPGLSVTAIPVPHRDEFSDTMAYKIRGPNRCVLFVPDIDRWERTGDLLDDLFRGVDVAYIDATFYDGRELPNRDMSEIPHPPMVDSMERLADRAASVRFIHFNHTNPALRDAALRSDVERRGFRLARRGERVRL